MDWENKAKQDIKHLQEEEKEFREEEAHDSPEEKEADEEIIHDIDEEEVLDEEIILDSELMKKDPEKREMLENDLEAARKRLRKTREKLIEDEQKREGMDP